jgi:hypothetical protein
MELSPGGMSRVATAVNFYHSHNLLEKSGIVVSSGYKSPGEHPTEKQFIPELGYETDGVPEAVIMDRLMEQQGEIPKENRRIEAHSIDTTTNFAFSRSLFPQDGAPIGIVAQRAHLDRMLEHIAPKILNRPFFGIIVPEIDPKDPETDDKTAALFSRIVLAGLNPESKRLDTRVERRAKVGWAIGKVVNRLRGQDHYNPGEAPKTA